MVSLVQTQTMLLSVADVPAKHAVCETPVCPGEVLWDKHVANAYVGHKSLLNEVNDIFRFPMVIFVLHHLHRRVLHVCDR